MADSAHHIGRGGASYLKTLGITERVITPTEQWTGELRVRFSDFQVNEIGLDGLVIHLRTVGLSETQKPTTEKEPNPEAVKTDESNVQTVEAVANGAVERGGDETAKGSAPIDISADDMTALEHTAGVTFAKALVELYKSSDGSENEKKRSITSEPLDDKSQRGQIHQEVRRIFKGRIDTNTSDAGAIVASLVSPKRANKRERKGRGRQQEKPGGEYLHFTMSKDNRDTMDAINQISRLLRTKPQLIGYAGTKDRRASTVQRCSVRYTQTRALAGINGKLWGISTGDYQYHDRPIHLGQLLGNEFVITIKDCHMTGQPADLSFQKRLEMMQASVTSALDHMAAHGWINYFGNQRFGTHRIGTHEIGKLILGDKYEDAVNALLYFDPQIASKAEKEDIPSEASKRDEYARHQACMLFMTGEDIHKAVKIMPKRFSAEVCLLRHLTRAGSQSRRDFVGALIHITKGLRSMYLHAYQSYVWNHAASKRWTLHGEKVVKGDVVLEEAQATPLVSGQDQDGDDIVNVIDDDDDSPTLARPLTEEEAASGRYTIYDIVLPSPGYDVVYPDNEIGVFYEEFMGREENGSLDPHKMRRLRREFSLPGRYRKVMNRFLAKPSIEVMSYTDDTDQMHPTDLDTIRAAKGSGRKRSHDEAGGEPGGEPADKKARLDDPAAAPGGPSDVGEMTQSDESAAQAETASSEPAAKRIATVVKFQLGRSAYATIALRELMGDAPDEAV